MDRDRVPLTAAPGFALAPVWPAWPTYTRATIRPWLVRHAAARPPRRPAPRRCHWAREPLDVEYHDREWGVPVRDDRTLFEFLLLEGAQAGLSWSTILRKRGAYRRAFAGFDPRRVARFGAADVTRLLGDAGIVRNRAKIHAAVANAQAFLAVQAEHGSFTAYLWAFVDGRPLQGRRRSFRAVPAETALSRALSDGSPEARLPLRRPDDLLRVHAGGRARQRPHARLLPPRPGRPPGRPCAAPPASQRRRRLTPPGHRARSSSSAAAMSRPRSAITRRPVAARAAAGQPK